MEDYNKIIESLGIKFLKAKNIKLLQPIHVRNYYDVENTLVLLHQGSLSFGPDQTKVNEGDILFIPGGKLLGITYGGVGASTITNEEFVSNKEKYFAANREISRIGTLTDSFSQVSFEAKVFDSVNFFASLDIPPFVINGVPELTRTIQELVAEQLQEAPGKERITQLKTDEIVVEIVRYILRNRMFVEKLATNSTYFKDPRLIDIFNHIKINLGGDLSNKILANVANVSEDYVGQYFKMLTGINPQDYIEYQRMEQAVKLLRTSKKSIREIGHEVGYKDTAYFCRRFKMMFGIPAGKMRRRETLMNI
ncbi:MAG: AraC family transcriptional regulator [Cytophagales bacterium]|jgi:AraC-like DNA-binding protein|nr:AraC family transcriptional regulator [Cytophagales bacterium]